MCYFKKIHYVKIIDNVSIVNLQGNIVFVSAVWHIYVYTLLSKAN